MKLFDLGPQLLFAEKVLIGCLGLIIAGVLTLLGTFIGWLALQHGFFSIQVGVAFLCSTAGILFFVALKYWID